MDINTSIHIHVAVFFFSMMAAGGWYCSRVRSGRNVTPPTPQHSAPHTHTHTHTPPSSFRPTTRPPPTFPPPPPPHPPPYHLQRGLISIRIEPGLPFLVTDFYKTIGQCARDCQLHFFVFQCLSLRLRVTTSHSTVKQNSRDMHTK